MTTELECVVCGMFYEPSLVPEDVRLTKVLADNLIGGYGCCKEHIDAANLGYIALVGAVNKDNPTSLLNINRAKRTGSVLQVTKYQYESIFRQMPPITTFPMVWVHEPILQQVRNLLKDA